MATSYTSVKAVLRAAGVQFSIFHGKGDTKPEFTLTFLVRLVFKNISEVINNKQIKKPRISLKITP